MNKHKQFRKRRLKLGWSQQEIADILQVRQATISDYETGKTKFRKEKQAFELLGVPEYRIELYEAIENLKTEIVKSLYIKKILNWLTKLINKLNSKP